MKGILMRITTTRRIVAGVSAGVAAATASFVLLLAPSAADAGHTLGRSAVDKSNGHTL